MANICSFEMVVIGEKDNIDAFIDMMSYEKNICMGRGAYLDEIHFEELKNGDYRSIIHGSVKGSIDAALICDAISMRINPQGWYHYKDVNELTFITLFEACKQLHLNMEVYSDESTLCFQEHYKFIDGELLVSDIESYTEDYDEETEEWTIEGGFEDCDFEL